MTGTQFAALIRYKTGTNSTTFTDADMLPLANIFKDEIASAIVERNNKYFLIPATDDLVASSTRREYAYPDSVLNHLHKVETKFASTDSRFPLIPLKEYDGSETEAEIVLKFSNTEGSASYVVRRRAIFILSGTITAVTGGLRIWYNKYPADLADLTGSTSLEVDPSTTTFGMPRQFHELWARRVGMEWKCRQPKPMKFNVLELNYPNDLEAALSAIASSDNSLEIIGDMPSKEDMWNDGADL